LTGDPVCKVEQDQSLSEEARTSTNGVDDASLASAVAVSSATANGGLETRIEKLEDAVRELTALLKGMHSNKPFFP